jgi:uncharacterized membrane protein YbjE (DUF340 family)
MAKIKVRKYTGFLATLEERDAMRKTDNVLNGLFLALMIFMSYLSVVGLARYDMLFKPYEFFAAALSLLILSFGMFVASKLVIARLIKLEKKVTEKLNE